MLANSVLNLARIGKIAARTGRKAGDVALHKFLSNAGLTKPSKFLEGAVMDLMGGVVVGALTPGDLGDKMIAGGLSAGGGLVGSSALRGVTGARGGIPFMLQEGLGGMGGDLAMQPVADALLRVKGGGTTPIEKMQEKDLEVLKEQIVAQYLAGKGGYEQEPNGVIV